LIRTWANVKTNWPAEHQYVSGGEVFRGKQVDAQASHVFRTRTISGLTTEMRVLWEGTYYGIVSIKEPYTRETWLECREAD
jgi:head-tail adaptor